MVLDIPVSFKRAPKSPKTKDILQITVPQVLQVSKVNLIVYFSGQMSPAFGFIRGFDYSQGKKKYVSYEPAIDSNMETKISGTSLSHDLNSTAAGKSTRVLTNRIIKLYTYSM